jgi:dTDP-4-amino-4,6-dideoxygalactose transaminase
VHRQPAYAGRLRVIARPGAAPGSLPVTEEAAASVLSLPVHPQLTDEQGSAVIESVREWAATLA